MKTVQVQENIFSIYERGGGGGGGEGWIEEPGKEEQVASPNYSFH